MGAINFRYRAGQLLKKLGYKLSREGLHLLQVDTEGMDYQMLQWFFDAGVEPDVLNFESLHLTKVERLASRQLLNARGYWWIESDQDTFTLKESLVKIQQN